MSLTIVPVTFRAAAAFVAAHHRHNKAPRGHKFSIGVCDAEGVLHGVAMVGRPVARHFDDGLTAEVNRTCTDGSSLTAAGWLKVRDLPARRGWADSSIALRAMRDPVGNGGVERALWERTP